MQIKIPLTVREVAGEYFLIPIGKSALDLNGMITTNDVGVSIWNALAQAEDEEDLVRAIMEEYEADENQVRSDVLAFLAQLRSLGII